MRNLIKTFCFAALCLVFLSVKASDESIIGWAIGAMTPSKAHNCFKFKSAKTVFNTKTLIPANVDFYLESDDKPVLNGQSNTIVEIGLVSNMNANNIISQYWVITSIAKPGQTLEQFVVERKKRLG